MIAKALTLDKFITSTGQNSHQVCPDACIGEISMHNIIYRCHELAVVHCFCLSFDVGFSLPWLLRCVKVVIQVSYRRQQRIYIIIPHAKCHVTSWAQQATNLVRVVIVINLWIN